MPEEDVLVGEGQQGPAVLVRHDALEGGLGPRGAVDQRQPDQQGRGPPDALEGAERVPPELVPLPGLGDEHPGLTLLGEVADVETGWPVRTKIRHFDQLSVAERSAILGAHYDRHEVSLLVVLTRSQPARTARVADRPVHGRHHPRSDAISDAAGTSSGEDGALAEQPLELAHQAVAAVHVELRREAQDLGADVEQHR